MSIVLSANGKVLGIVYRTLTTHITKKQTTINRRHKPPVWLKIIQNTKNGVLYEVQSNYRVLVNSLWRNHRYAL
jgi:hypothetical protein